MRNRWDEDEEEPGLGRSRVPEPEPEPTLGESIDAAVRKVVTSIVIAGGLIALGLYSSGGSGDPSVDYQITSTPDGTVYRLDSEDGRIVACREQRCWRLLSSRRDIDEDEPEENEAAALPAPAQTQTPPAQPQAATAQPGQAQLPAPQNTQAPATR
jgi:hypothetical protein